MSMADKIFFTGAQKMYTINMKVTFTKATASKEVVETGIFADIVKSAHQIIGWMETQSVFCFQSDGTHVLYLRKNQDGSIHEEIRKITIHE